MRIKLKEAPELGWLKVVSDVGVSDYESCNKCCFLYGERGICTFPEILDMTCITHEIHFEKVVRDVAV